MNMPIVPIHAATLTGLVDLLNPDPATITIEAMAHGLANINRFAGALALPISVAQHSVLVAEIFCRLQPGLHHWRAHALLHDGHEYALGDITTPAARLFEAYDAGFMKRLDRIKARIDAAIRAHLCIASAPIAVHAAIAEADAMAAGIEWRAFIPAANGPSPFPGVPWAGLRPKPLPWPQAADLFRARLDDALADAPTLEAAS